MAGLRVHFCLALGSQSPTSAGALLDNTQAFQLLQRVTNQSSRRLGATRRLHASALAAAVDLAEFAGTDSATDVDLTRDGGCWII